MEVTPFGLAETDDDQRLWVRGGFPLSFLAETDSDSSRWRTNYIKIFLERDIPALGIQIPPMTLRRFWMMLAHYHGQTFNASEIGKSLGVADTTASRYLDILTGTFMVRRLGPWFENLRKHHGFEFKYTDTPRRTKSQKMALECLRLDRLDIICPGNASYPLGEKLHVTGLEKAASMLAPGRLEKRDSGLQGRRERNEIDTLQVICLWFATLKAQSHHFPESDFSRRKSDFQETIVA